MKKKYTKKEVLNKIVQKLNKEGFKKESLHEVGKEELKKILREIYDECSSFGGLDKSPLENWSQACKEIKAEKEENKEEIKETIKDDNYKSIDKEENKKDILKREDYDDDLIQLEFPKVYIDKIHSPKIEKLSEQLEKQRKEERNIREEYDKKIYDVIKIYIDKKEKSQQIKVDEKKNTEKKINDLKDDMKQKIKDNSHMTNNEFLMLLYLMKLKKETLYESNPYIVDYSVTLESVYQSGNDDEEDEDIDYSLVSKFESDLNKYLD